MTLRTALFALTDAAYQAFDAPRRAAALTCIMCDGGGTVRPDWGYVAKICPNCNGRGAILPKDGTPNHD